MTSEDIVKERLSLMPVRELITVTEVRSQWLSKSVELFLVRGYLDETPLASRHLRTLDPWKASICKEAIGGRSVAITWQRDPFSRMSWNEHNILKVEP